MVTCEGEKKQWATTDEEWESCKGLIKGLYYDQRKPLKVVMEIMRREYNFHAT